MAPKKHIVKQGEMPAHPVANMRVTRNAAKRATIEISADVSAEAPPKKKAKGSWKGKEKVTEDVKPDEDVNAKPTEKKAKVSEELVDAQSTMKTILIEHCKQCKSFEIRANHVRDGLEKSVPGITVHVNPEKPRRGCFEIREEDGEKFVSLLNLKRPFAAMKKLDMDEIVADIIKKIK